MDKKTKYLGVSGAVWALLGILSFATGILVICYLGMIWYASGHDFPH